MKKIVPFIFTLCLSTALYPAENAMLAWRLYQAVMTRNLARIKELHREGLTLSILNHQEDGAPLLTIARQFPEIHAYLTTIERRLLARPHIRPDFAKLLIKSRDRGEE